MNLRAAAAYMRPKLTRVRASIFSVVSFEQSPIYPPLIITGSQRSATTWLQEYCGARIGKSRLVFEPFNPVRNLSTGLVSMPQDVVEKNLRGAISGGYSTNWTRRLTYPLLTNNRIIKCVCLHHHVDTICRLYPESGLIHVVRDPVRVAFGRMSTGFPFPSIVFTESDELIRENYEGFQGLDDVRKLFLYILIDNLVAVAKGSPFSNFEVFKLEDLKGNISLLQDYLTGRGYKLSNYKERDFSKASSTSFLTKAMVKSPQIEEQRYFDYVYDRFGMNYQASGYPILSIDSISESLRSL